MLNIGTLVQQALWPLVALVLVITLAGPLRQLVRALALQISSGSGSLQLFNYGKFSWKARVRDVLPPLRKIDAARSAGEVRAAINVARTPVDSPSDIVAEAHGAVYSALLAILGTDPIPDLSQAHQLSWPIANQLIGEGKIDARLSDAVQVLDDLFFIAGAQSGRIDRRNAEEFVRLAEAILVKLPEGKQP